MSLKDLIFGGTAAEEPPSPERREGSVHKAAAVLLLEMAGADDEFSEEERRHILSILQREYGLTEEEALTLAEEAEEEREKSLDLYYFTEQINREFSRDEKIRMVELLWEVVFADETLTGHEDYLIHTLTKLLGLDHRELIGAKLSVLDRRREK